MVSTRQLYSSEFLVQRNFNHTKFSRGHWYWRESNPQPLATKTSAVSIELTWLTSLWFLSTAFSLLYGRGSSSKHVRLFGLGGRSIIRYANIGKYYVGLYYFLLKLVKINCQNHTNLFCRGLSAPFPKVAALLEVPHECWSNPAGVRVLYLHHVIQQLWMFPFPSELCERTGGSDKCWFGICCRALFFNLKTIDFRRTSKLASKSLY